MIKKITLNNIASFKEKQQLKTDQRINFIYGLNGTGKTTVSNYLQDLDNGCFSKCRIEGFNPDKQKILVYNQNFIKKVFYEKETQQGIFTFTLGEDNKEAKENIQTAQSEIDKLNLRLNDENNQGFNLDITKIVGAIKRNIENSQNKIWKIKTEYTGGDRVFDSAGFLDGLKGNRANLFEHILSIELSEPQKDIDQIKKEIQELGPNAGKRIEFNPIQLADFLNIEDNNIFNELIVGNEDSSVSGLINELKNSDWVKHGVDYYVDLEARKNCPFCQQETLNNILVEEIKKYFDNSYQENIDKLKNLKFKYEELKKSLPLEQDYQREFFTEEQRLEVKNLCASLVNVLDKNLESINKKIASPGKPAEIVSSKTCMEELNNFIIKRNTEIQEFNAKLDDKTTTIEDLKTEFWKIQRHEYDQTIVNYREQEDEFEAEKTEIQADIDEIEGQIKEQNEIILENLSKASNTEETIKKINAHLLDFGITDFKIVSHGEEDTYKLQRDDNSNKIFETLSEGEKTVISFLYFVELCIGEETLTNIKRKIIVIDDPISSLSHIYVFNVASLLKKHFLKQNPTFLQCFVLTHNLYFFNELIMQTKTKRDDNKPKPKLFRISKNKNSQILEMEANEIQNEYQSYWQIVKEGNINSKFVVANAMRNIIEYFFGFMEQQENLTAIFQKEEFSNNKYKAFKRYINRESHSNLINISDFKDFDLAIFQEVFKNLFKVAGYEKHYKKMTK